MYDIVLYFYKKGIYTEDDAYQFVLSGDITEEEYNKIIDKKEG